MALLQWLRSTFWAGKHEIDLVRDQISSIDAQPYSVASTIERSALMTKLD